MTHSRPIPNQYCDERHTSYQPTDEEFRCPSCGAGAGEFYIDDPASETCDALHTSDGIVCTNCGKNTKGRTFAARLAKRAKLKTCLHCNGSGVVSD